MLSLKIKDKLGKSKVEQGSHPKRYYVYVAISATRILYIGKGSTWRYLHCLEGTSSNYKLNKHHFEGKEIDVYLVKDDLSQTEAFVLEAELILLHNPDFNNDDGCTRTLEEYSKSSAIECIKELNTNISGVVKFKKFVNKLDFNELSFPKARMVRRWIGVLLTNMLRGSKIYYYSAKSRNTYTGCTRKTDKLTSDTLHIALSYLENIGLLVTCKGEPKNRMSCYFEPTDKFLKTKPNDL